MSGRLDAPLRELTGYQMRRAASEMLATVSAALAPFGLRRTTFSALTVIVDAPGLRQGRLAETLAIERPNMVRIVDELEAAKLVVREHAPDDGRAYALRPTLEGRRVQTQALAAVREADAALTRGLSSAEVAALRRALRIIEQNAGEALKADGLQVSRS